MEYNEYLDLILHIPFEKEGEPGYLSVIQRCRQHSRAFHQPADILCIACIPRGGSCSFYVEQDANCNWISECLPSFIDNDFICVITDRIKSKGK